MIDLHLGDCLAVMRTLSDGCVDAVVTDPPAGIAFMGKDWDNFGGRANANAEQDRHSANRGPGAGMGNQPFGYSGSAMSTVGQRSNFIAFLTGAMAECLRVAKPGAHALVWALPRTSHWTATAMEDAGWIIEDRITHHFGQGFPKHKSKLKPATEDWWLCTKPGGAKWLNVDGCRIGDSKRVPGSVSNMTGLTGFGERTGRAGQKITDGGHDPNLGRWPANLVLTHHPDCNGECVEGCPVAELDRQSGTLESGKLLPHHADNGKGHGCLGAFRGRTRRESYGDSGGASRFFYCSKASRADRDEGNTHPTVKSTDLMRWLCRLVTPAGGTILDPFMGSGSTLKAAVKEGFGAIGIESDPAYHAIAERRIAAELRRYPLLDGAVV